MRHKTDYSLSILYLSGGHTLRGAAKLWNIIDLKKAVCNSTSKYIFKKILKDWCPMMSEWHFVASCQRADKQADSQTGIANFRLNWPRGFLSKNILLYLLFSLSFHKFRKYKENLGSNWIYYQGKYFSFIRM